MFQICHDWQFANHDTLPSLAMTGDSTKIGGVSVRSTINSALALLMAHSLIPDPDRSCHVTATMLNYDVRIEVTLRHICCNF